MKIIFHGKFSTDSAIASLISIFRLFEDKYAISNFQDVELDMAMQDTEGEDIEIINASNSEVIDIIDVYENEADRPKKTKRQKPHLRLAVDNTRKS